MKRKLIVCVLTLICMICTWGQSARKAPLAPSYAWEATAPLGLREPASIDTLPDNYGQRSVPSAISSAYATTGNLGAQGQNMIWLERAPMSDFFFRDALTPWLPSLQTMRFYNTRSPMTLLSYNTAGGRDNAQERLSMTFSGNINSKAQIGALLDYIYSKGCYTDQADKGLIWGASGSYIGDRYEMQAFYNHYNLLNKENGGITDPLYITDPALIQGGVTKVDPKTIPVRLTQAHTRLKGNQLWVNNRYKIGYWHTEREGDSITSRVYIPTISVIHTLEYRGATHMFRNNASGGDFFENTYYTYTATADFTSYWSLRNTVGISMLEGFSRWAKFGLAAYATYEINRYTQALDSVAPAEDLTPLPLWAAEIPTHATEHKAYIGAQLTKQRGNVLRYAATAELGLSGKAAGDLRVHGDIDTKVSLRDDSLKISAFGHFYNEAAPLLMQQFRSNHFLWNNNFGKERRVGFGGSVSYSKTGTCLSAQVDNVQNHIYFGQDFLPAQNGGSVQILSLRLLENIRLGWFNWDNTLTWQKTTKAEIIPLPELAIYSNLYFKFRIATLFAQVGVDCDWYTRYYAPKYQPATSSFATQTQTKIGNYPFMNLYANLKLSKVRFYVMMSHINQGWFSRDYFSMPDYPLNPRRFQLGLSIDFAN